MKKAILLIAVAWLMLPVKMFAQYSNATLNGPWIAVSNDYSYIFFDGNGYISGIGTSDDSLHPVGTYNITPSGALTATLNVVEGTQMVYGRFLNDSTVIFADTVPHTPAQ
jgi:hypothetical protein